MSKKETIAEVEEILKEYNLFGVAIERGDVECKNGDKEFARLVNAELTVTRIESFLECAGYTNEVSAREYDHFLIENKSHKENTNLIKLKEFLEINFASQAEIDSIQNGDILEECDSPQC